MTNLKHSTSMTAIYLMGFGAFMIALFPPLGIGLMVWGYLMHRSHRNAIKAARRTGRDAAALRRRKAKYAAYGYLDSLAR